MNKINIINCEWNCYNGFVFNIFELELYKPINIDSSLFGINVSRNFFYIDLLFIKIKLFDKTESYQKLKN